MRSGFTAPPVSTTAWSSSTRTLGSVERHGSDAAFQGRLRAPADRARRPHDPWPRRERGDDLAVISPGSPLGTSLVGRQAGDVVEYQAPGGTLKVEVVAVDV